MRKQLTAIWYLAIILSSILTAQAATRTVDTTSDSGALTACTAAPNDCSLRGAASFSSSGETIDFAPSLTGATITLGSIITFNFRGVNIIGPGADKLTISGNNTTSIMEFLQAQSPVIISGVTFANGNGIGGFNEGQGGAIETNNCPFPITFDRVVFRNNSAALNSGALLCLSTACRVTNSTFTGNIAAKASAVSFFSTFEMTNTTVSGNTETLLNWYGAVLVSGVGIIRNSTIVNNPGSSNIYVTSTLRIGNSIVSGHPSNDIFRGSGGIVITEGSNIISRNFNVQSVFPVGAPNANGDYVSASGQINPQLAPLAYYGGSTPTHALLPNSVALNHGNNCVVNNSCATTMIAPLTTDQRGAARQVAALVDIGAFENNITFDQTNLPNGVLNTLYNTQLSATRATNLAETLTTTEKFDLFNSNLAPFTFSIINGALPPGLSLAPNGTLSGTPAQVGIFTFMIKAVDGADTLAGVKQFVIQVFAPTAANASVSGRILTAEGGLRNARVILTDLRGNSRTVSTGTFGYYRFDNVAVGETYIVSVVSKRFTFASQVISVMDHVSELNFTANE